MNSRLPHLAVAAALVLLFAAARLPQRHPAALGALGRGPTVVLLHGLGSSSEHWLPVARDLARDHRVVMVELPGHGLAGMAVPLSLDRAALALDRAIREQGPDPVVLVGHSVGGLVAATEALRAPGRVRALVLVETALRPQLAPAEREALLASLRRDLRGTLREVYAGFGRDSAQGALLAAEAERVDPAVLRAWIRLAVTADVSREVAGLRAPLLAVLSSRSWPDSESWAAAGDSLGYAAAPRTTPVRIEGVGHFVMLDRPRLVADVIRRFARDSGPPVVAAR